MVLDQRFHTLESKYVAAESDRAASERKAEEYKVKLEAAGTSRPTFSSSCCFSDHFVERSAADLNGRLQRAKLESEEACRTIEALRAEIEHLNTEKRRQLQVIDRLNSEYDSLSSTKIFPVEK